ncbi:MAG TPA: hypothetical protein ENI80_00005 [Acidiferrobacteraceae bacterium]|nr:hypothetical protein [Acidiferrobacteraceae bacterium]
MVNTPKVCRGDGLGRCRWMPLSVAFLMLLTTSAAHALGLGRLDVRSALDQNLVAAIPLIAVNDKERRTLEVKLGSREQFSKAAIPRPSLLTRIKFEVKRLPDGGDVIKLTSGTPIKEPFLHFLIQLEWAGGRLVKEFTTLLDPPHYLEGQSPEVTSPRLDPVAPGAQEPDAKTQPYIAPTPITPQSPTPVIGPMELLGPPEVGQGASPVYDEAPIENDSAEAKAPELVGAVPAQVGPTKRGDTLWGYSRSLKAGLGANEYQIMLSLLRENPDVFVANNIHRMRVGKILKVPSPEVVQAISPADARATYKAQLDAWQDYKSRFTQPGKLLTQPSGPGPDKDTAIDKPQAKSSARVPEPKAAKSSATGVIKEQAKPTAKKKAGSEEKDLLKIVQATLDSEKSASATAPGTAADAVNEKAVLRNKITTLEEAMLSGELENKELTERLKLLEEQVANAQRLIEMQNTDLALAQKKAAQDQQAAEQAKIDAQKQTAEQQKALEDKQAMERQRLLDQQKLVGQQRLAAEQQAVEAQRQLEEKQTTERQRLLAQQKATEQQQAVQEPAVVAAPIQPIAKPKPISTPKPKLKPIPTTQPVPQGDFVSELLQPILDSFGMSSMVLVGAGGGIILVVVVAMWMIRRRRSIAEFEDSILSGSALDSRTHTTPSEQVSGGTDTSFLSDFGVPGMGSMHADEVDPLAEAEVYLAYGRSEQAEEVLREAANKHPDRPEIKIKLLEIYEDRKDLNAFETLAEELYPAQGAAGDPTWARVVEMGKRLNPDNPLFSGETAAPAAQAAAPSPSEEDNGLQPFQAPDNKGLELDLDDFLGPAGTDAPADISPAAAEADAASGIDFDATGKMDTLDVAGGLDETPATKALDLTSTVKSDVSEMGAVELADSMRREGELKMEGIDLDLGDNDVALSDDADVDEAFAATESLELKAEQRSDTVQLDEPDLSGEIDLGTTADDLGAGLNGESISWDDTTLTTPPDDVAVDAGLGEMSFDADLVEPGGGEPAKGNGDAGVEDMSQWDEAATKLDLAKAYIDMGDQSGARSILDEVLSEGNDAQKQQATDLAAQLGG